MRLDLQVKHPSLERGKFRLIRGLYGTGLVDSFEGAGGGLELLQGSFIAVIGAASSARREQGSHKTSLSQFDEIGTSREVMEEVSLGEGDLTSLS